MSTEQTTAGATEDERAPETRAWAAPDFEEVDLGNEITAYVGRW